MNEAATHVVEIARNSLKDHVLVPVVESGPVLAYYLRKPGHGRMMSCLILFSREGIVIQGDITPERNGSVSALGYGIEWFGSPKSQSYLCEKFLHRQWVRELAQEELRDPKGCPAIYHPKLKKKFRELAEEIEDGGPELLHHALVDLGYDTSDGIPGHGYVPREAGWLIGIQECFARLYQEHLNFNADHQLDLERMAWEGGLA